MRAHTIITKSRPRRKARYSVLALALGVCALAIPATASGDSTQPDDGGAVAAGNAHRTATELAQTTAADEPSGSGGGSPQVDSDHASPNTILRGAHEPSTAEPTFVSDSTGTTGEGFDWASALVGAGSAMALVALGGAVFLTVRKRSEVSPSASTS
jgi:hypothetical protein